MSGGIGPSSDITLPNDDPHPAPAPAPAPISASPLPPPPRSFFTFRQLNALAVAVVLSASGMVCMKDLAFVIFSLLYVILISRTSFPSTSPSPPVFTGRNANMLTIYVAIAALIGLFLPIAYILEGIFEGDKEGIKAAAPHVFLLVSQVFMEGVTFAGEFSLPIRVFVPVFYNSRRIFTIAEWLRSEIAKAETEESGGGEWRVCVGRGLAVANMAFWCFNLFVFLLPVYLPRAFKIYYSNKSSKLN